MVYYPIDTKTLGIGRVP